MTPPNLSIQFHDKRLQCFKKIDIIFTTKVSEPATNAPTTIKNMETVSEQKL